MGRVYVAEHELLGKKVAIQVLLAEHSRNPELRTTSAWCHGWHPGRAASSFSGTGDPMRNRAWLIVLVMVGGCDVSGQFIPIDSGDDGPGDAGVDSDAAPPPFTPIHLTQDALNRDALDVALTADLTTIDTAALTIGGQESAYFVRRGTYAVLFAKELSIRGTVKVTGTAPLIAVASGAITIAGRIDLSAAQGTAGPGASEASLGAGGDGQSAYISGADVQVSSGGGGGGYGTAGGGGSGGAGRAAPGIGGPIYYGLQPGDPLVGGARGGRGGCRNGPCIDGGAGGGALQLSSAISITILPLGVITAAGAGGSGGGWQAVGGGGGGAGGEILLEAPSIVVAGTLAANGGGGGGAGGNGSYNTPQGQAGEDGHDSATPALGGPGGIPMGSDGGSGAAGTADGFHEAQNGHAGFSEGGGGGGGAGRIWLRHRATIPPDRTGSTISPPVSLDDTL